MEIQKKQLVVSLKKNKKNSKRTRTIRHSPFSHDCNHLKKKKELNYNKWTENMEVKRRYGQLDKKLHDFGSNVIMSDIMFKLLNRVIWQV